MNAVASFKPCLLGHYVCTAMELREKWNKPIFVVQSGINKIIKKFFFSFSLLDQYGAFILRSQSITIVAECTRRNPTKKNLKLTVTFRKFAFYLYVKLRRTTQDYVELRRTAQNYVGLRRTALKFLNTENYVELRRTS